MTGVTCIYRSGQQLDVHYLGHKYDNDSISILYEPRCSSTIITISEPSSKKIGSSGIIYNVEESPKYEQPFFTGPEYQILDNIGHSDGAIYKHRAGDNYDLTATKFVTVNEVEE